MVQLMLEGLGGDHRARTANGASSSHPGDVHGIQCYHVNTRLSKRLQDIGEFRGGKLVLLVLYCLQAIWCHFRYGITHFYYIPAPGKTSALYRDWLVMFLCRPFYKKVILHWHAAGLGKWLETSVQSRTRAMTYHFARQVDLSIVLSRYNMADAEKLLPQRVRVVSNGIPDPCPDFRQTILARRRARHAARVRLLSGQSLSAADLQDTGGDPNVVNVLYVAHCMEEKGLFDAMRGTIIANRALAERGSPVRLKLLAAGTFVARDEKARFDQLMADPEFDRAVDYLGFVSGAGKDSAFRNSDMFCFPTYYLGENQPVNIIEAMAFGLPIVTTRWRSLPEMLPADYAGLVPVRSPEKIAAAMLEIMAHNSGEGFRQMFLGRYTLESHLGKLAEALASVDHPEVAHAPLGATAPR